VTSCKASFIMGQLMPHMSVRATRAQSWRRLNMPRSDGDRRFDGGVVLVVEDLEVVERVVEDRRGAALDVERGIGVGLARELQLLLLAVVAVDVAVAAGPDDLTDVQVALLREHVREQ